MREAFKGKNALANGNRRYKDPKAEAWQACLRNSKEVNVAEEEREEEDEAGGVAEAF